MAQQKINVTPQDIEEAEKIENDTKKMLMLIDLLFLDRDRDIPS